MKLIPYLSSSALLFLLTLSTACHAISYQSHSFNDLDYIIQQLIKGIDSFKIDVSAIDHDSCMHYSTWKHNDNKCEVDNMHNKICCLGLRGDASSAPKLNDYFNTTDELVSVLQNTKYDFIWNKDKRLQQYNQTIYIALNIQYDYLSGTITKTWLSNMIRAISTRNLDIQLILGGPAVVNYFGSLCKLASKGCDDDARVIAEYPFILQGDTMDVQPLPFGSIKNFNIIFPDIPQFCSSGFPTYGDGLPYYFYELSHEQDVQFVVNTYMDDQCNRSQTHPDMSTVRITSNVDPEMIQTYLPHNNPFSDFTHATNMLVETLEADKLILFAYYDTLHNVTNVQVRALNDSLNVVSGKQLQCPPPTKISYKAPYLLLHSEQQAQIFLLDASGFLTLYPMYKIMSPGIATDIFVYDSGVYLIKVDVNGQCTGNSLSFTMTSLDAEQQVFTQCSDQIQAFDVNEIQNADLSVVLDSSNTLNGILFISAAHMNYGDQKDALYAFSLSYNMVLGQALSVMIPRSYIDFGVDPSVKLIENNNTLFVLEVHSNGICQSGAMMNNGNMFKCGVSSTPNPHIASLQNLQYLMNYNWGQLSDFEARIQSGKYVNGCDSKIMHAKFSNGENPNGVVFRNSTTGALQALFVNQYVEYGDLPLMTKLFCGATAPRSEGAIAGTVGLSVFDVVDYELFSYL